MKYCDKCKRNFSDNEVFCTMCGNKLNNSVPNSNGTSSNNLEVWIPMIFAAIGALVGWYLSGLLGLVLGAVGLSMAIQAKKQGRYEPLPFVLTWGFAIIDVIFWLIAVVASAVA